MKTFLDRKFWLFSLSFILAASYTPTFAQNGDHVQTGDKVTTIQTTSDKNTVVFVESSEKKPNNSCYKKYTFSSNYTPPKPPKLGVLLKGDESPTGLVVLKTFPNSAASSIGLIANDKILSVNGQSTTTVANLRAILANQKIGDNITVQYERAGTKVSKKVALQATQSNHYLNQRENYYHNDYYETAEWKEKACEKLEEIKGRAFLGVYLSQSHQNESKGAPITTIITGTGAEAATLQANDKIIQMNSVVIGSTDEAIDFIQSKQPGDAVRIRIIRDEKVETINATLGAWADSPRGKRKVAFLSKYCTEEEVIEEIEVIEEEETVVKTPEITEEVDATDEAAVATPLTLENAVTLDVFPNPTTDQVTVKFEGKKAPLTISIVSLDGREMYTNTIANFDGFYNNQLQLEDYPSGVYFVNLKQGKEQYTQQVVVE